MFGEDVGGEGRRLRRDPGPAEAGRRGAGVRHAARRAVDPRPRARRRGHGPRCRCPRSSTSPTCTTPRTSSGARPRRSSSSPTASTATRWSCASPATATRRASAGTSTTTTPSACCATSPGWSIASPARPDDAAAMLRTCVAAAARRRQRLRVPRADRALPHDATCTSRATGLAGPYAAPAGGRRARADRRGARPRRRRDLTIVTCGNGAVHEPAGRAAARGRRHRRAGGRPALARAAPRRGRPARGRRHGAGARGRRDPADRRDQRGRPHGAGRRRLRRAAWPGWPARTPSSRSATPLSTCCCPRTRSTPRPWHSSPARPGSRNSPCQQSSSTRASPGTPAGQRRSSGGS